MSEEQIPYRQLRKNPEEIKAALDRLDQQANQSQAAKNRCSERYAYRMQTLKVEIPQPGGPPIVYSVPSRNISREGLSFLIGHFVYPKTVCRISLQSLHNHTITISGTVMRCRYLEGSSCLHEVGVKFDRTVDVAMFHRGATRIRILLADDDPSMRNLLERLLKSLNVELVCIEDRQQAIEKALSNHFDLVLMDLEMPTDGLNLVKELREGGYARPVVALTAATAPEEHTKCLAAGFSSCLTKPVTREMLLNMVISLKDDPIVSSLVNVPEMADLIDQFVEGLPGRINKLETAFRAGELPTLERLARDMKGKAGTYGFEVITKAAAVLEQTISQKAELGVIRAKLTDLCRLCLAARPVSGIERS